jgi:uncharacterized membrane protein YidH (DUF202 family)
MEPTIPIVQSRRDAPVAPARGSPDSAWAHRQEDELAAMKMKSERLLLATMQCSLSLIGFGFTIYEIFSDVAARTGLARANLMGNRVGIALLGLGFILLAGGLWANARTGRQLVARRTQLITRGLMSPTRVVSISPVFVVASLLLLLTLTILAAIGARFLG